MIRGTSKSWLRSWLGLTLALHTLGAARASDQNIHDDLRLLVVDEATTSSDEMWDALNRVEVRIMDRSLRSECEPELYKEVEVTSDPTPEYKAPSRDPSHSRDERPEQLEYG